MPTFDWSISLGNILTTVFLLLSFIGGAYKFVFNHMEHLMAEMRRDVAAASSQVQLLRADVLQRLDITDKDIRELRDWTIVMRGSKRTRPN